MQSMQSTEIFLNGEEDYKFRKELQNKHTNKKSWDTHTKSGNSVKCGPNWESKLYTFMSKSKPEYH